MNIKPLIYSLLSTESTITDCVGTDIYPGAAPRSIGSRPCIVYQIISETPQSTANRAATRLFKFRIQFSCYAKDSATNSSIRQAMMDLMENKFHRVAGYDLNIFFINDIDSMEAATDASDLSDFKTVLDFFFWVS